MFQKIYLSVNTKTTSSLSIGFFCLSKGLLRSTNCVRKGVDRKENPIPGHETIFLAGNDCCKYRYKNESV